MFVILTRIFHLKYSVNDELRVEGFVKIARIGTVTIPDRQKTVGTVS
jgi:hypothetical protein